MNRARQRREVDANYDAFMRKLSGILSAHRGQYALMRDRQIVGYFDRPSEANVAGYKKFGDGVFSIQEVSDEPIDLGFWSHVASN